MSEKHETENSLPENPNEGLPAIFSSWKQVYWFVIGELALLIALFYGFTLYFA